MDGEVIRYASYDGMKIPAVLYRPHSATPDAPVPGLVWVHGGPGGQSRISPLFHASRISKLLLVVQGANDPRVLQVESDELVEAARKNGVPVEYVIFPDEGHGFKSKANRITASDKYVEFLDEHLKGKAGTEPAPTTE